MDEFDKLESLTYDIFEEEYINSNDLESSLGKNEYKHIDEEHKLNPVEAVEIMTKKKFTGKTVGDHDEPCNYYLSYLDNAQDTTCKTSTFKSMKHIPKSDYKKEVNEPWEILRLKALREVKEDTDLTNKNNAYSIVSPIYSKMGSHEFKPMQKIDMYDSTNKKLRVDKRNKLCVNL
jgi:hypothetical protein